MRRIKHRASQTSEPAATQLPLVVGPVVLDLGARRVLIEGHVVHLPVGEAVILDMLMRNPGRVLSRHELSVGADDRTARQLARLTRRLCRRLTVSPLLPRLIERVGRDGYRFIPISA